MRSPKKTNFSGCLVGQCLGDALGFPIEGHGPDACCDFVYNKAKVWFQGSAPVEHDWSGQYTDDSQLARELLESLVDHGRFEPEDYARRIADIFREDRIVGRGLATDKAAKLLDKGVHWKEAGCPAPSAGNGTAMRAAPVGMYFLNKPDLLVSVAHEQGWITHQDPRCSAGSIAIAGAVALALKGPITNVEKYVETLSNWMKPYHPEFAGLVMQLRDWVTMPPYKAVDLIAPAGKPKDYIEDWPGISPYVIPSVLWSLYSFLKYPDSYWDAISTSISIGGDVDTTGAMTGAISGAYLGLDALPSHLTYLLNDQGTWTFGELVQLADRCFDQCKEE